MKEYFEEFVKGGQFPWKSDVPYEKRDVYKQMPEAESLLNALEYLEFNNISWYDVHSGNIMVRPSTNELVIIDVGLYNQ
jgi:hypothetical protein